MPGEKVVPFRERFEKRWKLIISLALLFSLLFLIGSLVLIFCLPLIIETAIRTQQLLLSNTILMKRWANPEYYIRSNMYPFSLKNPDEMMKGAIPIVKRNGPYVFDQKQRRKIHSVGNGTVKYETFQTFHFNEDASCDECFLHNRLWIPNLVFQKFVEAASTPTMKAPAIAAMVIQTPFLEVEVAELLFEGYADPFLDQVCTIPFVNFVCERILDLPERIGLFYKKNDTSTGFFEVRTGEADNSKSIGEIISWNNSSKLPEYWWDSQAALAITGTDGTLLPPYLTKEDPLAVFVPELCRSINLVFQKEVEVSGILAYRFFLPKEEFDWTLPDKVGFCHRDSPKKFFEQQEKSCLPPGLLDISRCQKGEPPIVISLPNFMYTPDFVQKSVSGMRQPVQEIDQIELDIEPRLGSILRGHRRFQINIAVWRGIDLATLTQDISKLHNSVVPVLEIDEQIQIDDDDLALIKWRLIFVERGVKVGCIVVSIISLIGIAVLLLYIWHRIYRQNPKHFLRTDFVSPTPATNGHVRQSQF